MVKKQRNIAKHKILKWLPNSRWTSTSFYRLKGLSRHFGFIVWQQQFYQKMRSFSGCAIIKS
jgi:hypothetical protein